MASAFQPETRELLLDRIRFYRDLGLTDFYRRPVDPARMAQLADQEREMTVPEIAEPVAVAAFSQQTHHPQPDDSQPNDSQPNDFQEDQAIPPRRPLPSPPQIAAAIPEADRAQALITLREEIGDCTRCKLHSGRNQLVFGDGSPTARLMFIGEGPGADEDEQGIPFVGKAGQLLNNMIAAMGLERSQVYIANVVKCRPPANRVPEPDEAAYCTPFLFRQIDIVRPQVLVALGATAATYMLGSRQPLAGLRGRIHAVRGTQLIVTYHPAYLLRDPRQKKEAWADLQIAMRELGLKPPTKG